MVKPYRWGDVAPITVQAIRARRATRVTPLASAWVRVVDAFGQPEGIRSAGYPSLAEPRDSCVWVQPLSQIDPIRIPCSSHPACECKSPSCAGASPALSPEASVTPASSEAEHYEIGTDLWHQFNHELREAENELHGARRARGGSTC